MSWVEIKPTGNDLLAELPSLCTTNAVAFRQAIEKHSYWTDSSGVSAGLPRLSDGSAGPGAARAFFGVESSVSLSVASTKALSGRLFVTSDTSRLYGLTSANSVLLGGANVIVWQHQSMATIPNNTRSLIQYGTVNAVVGSVVTTAFPTAYTVAPAIQLMPMSGQTTALALVSVTRSGTTNFVVSTVTLYGSTSTFSTMWRSHGSVTL